MYQRGPLLYAFQIFSSNQFNQMSLCLRRQTRGPSNYELRLQLNVWSWSWPRIMPATFEICCSNAESQSSLQKRPCSVLWSTANLIIIWIISAEPAERSVICFDPDITEWRNDDTLLLAQAWFPCSFSNLKTPNAQIASDGYILRYSCEGFNSDVVCHLRMYSWGTSSLMAHPFIFIIIRNLGDPRKGVTNVFEWGMIVSTSSCSRLISIKIGAVWWLQ